MLIVHNGKFIYYLGIKRWNEYIEHGEDTEIDANFKRTSRNLEDEQDIMQLGEGILSRNLGLDVIVVVTKVKK